MKHLSTILGVSLIGFVLELKWARAVFASPTTSMVIDVEMIGISQSPSMLGFPSTAKAIASMRSRVSNPMVSPLAMVGQRVLRYFFMTYASDKGV